MLLDEMSVDEMSVKRCRSNFSARLVISSTTKTFSTERRVTRLGNFFQLGYFWRPIMIFWKDEVAQNNGDFLGNFLFQQIYYIFTQKKQFLNIVCCRYSF